MKYYQQLDAMDCGPTCLRMIAKHYGRDFDIQYLRKQSFISRRGVSLLGISEAAEHIGFRTMAIKVPFLSDGVDAGLIEAPLPCVIHWRQNHFVVVYKISKKYVWIADPADGKFKLTRAAFEEHWTSDTNKGVALLLEPTPDFYSHEGENISKTGFSFLFRYLRPYRKLLVQLVIGLLLGSVFQLIFPFLTQSVVDVGIQNQNVGFIWLVLIGQLMLFLSQTSVTLLQNWILLHISTRINVALISDFLIKLMKLPIGFFDAKMIGDLMQRIGDHQRIESFLTSSTLRVIFSVVNFIVFGAVLLMYNVSIFGVFLLASVLYITWVAFFLKKRKEVDYQRFQELSDNQSTVIELIQGMQEIKLQGSERKRRWAWAHIQAKLFRANIRSLAISQYQDAGGGFINQLKDILITFLAANAVIEGQMTLGMMLAVQYIVGQLNGPLNQMIGFVRSAQDAKISLERLGEIHNRDEEEKVETISTDLLPKQADIIFENVSFKYNELSENVLEEVSLTIPKGKMTAIVGTSGSGKTTLVKLLLGFYESQKGAIKIGNFALSNLNKGDWRAKCGAVMQDGFIFSDTIANNIAESDETPDRAKLLHAVQVANIQEFIESLPLSYNTVIGAQGNGVSQGQRQRLLIARAVYKNPDYLFFDEATNALDAMNERTIVENLNTFFEDRTVIVVAHRLSTVKNADQIVVLEKGKIVEIGTHSKLVQNRGKYYQLVKNQLELGS
jgi:ATP-binding cassette subfamily B protein